MGMVDPPLLAYVCPVEYFVFFATYAGFVPVRMVVYKLSKVFVRGYHIDLHVFF